MSAAGVQNDTGRLHVPVFLSCLLMGRGSGAVSKSEIYCSTRGYSPMHSSEFEGLQISPQDSPSVVEVRTMSNLSKAEHACKSSTHLEELILIAAVHLPRRGLWTCSRFGRGGSLI